MASPCWCRRYSSRTRMAGICLCSAASAQSKRHSAYRSQFVVIEYRWHPLYGKRLRISRRSARAQSTTIDVEVRPGLSRELPAWKCEASACSAMSLGPPQVSINALIQLRAVLTDRSTNQLDRASWTSSRTEESCDETTETTTCIEPGTGGASSANSPGVRSTVTSVSRSSAGSTRPGNRGLGKRKRGRR